MQQHRPHGVSEDPPEAFDLLDLVWIAAEHWRLILVCAVGFGISAVGISLMLKPTYTATVSLVPPRLVSQGGAVLVPPGEKPETAGSVYSQQVPVPPEFYVGLMQSESVTDALIHEFNLQHVYGEPDESRVRIRLEDVTTFNTDHVPLIQLSVRDKDAGRAAELANSYVNGLNGLLRRIAQGDSQVRQEVFTRELAGQRKELQAAEGALAQAQGSTGLLRPRQQASAAVASLAQLQRELAAKLAALHALKLRATDQNPQVLTLEAQVHSLEASMEAYRKAGGGKGSIEVAAERLPELQLEVARRQRVLDQEEEAFEMLSRGLEGAKLDAGVERPFVKVVDWATVPDRKSWPPRAVLVVLSALLGGLGGYAWMLAAALLRPEWRRRRGLTGAGDGAAMSWGASGQHG